MIERQQYQEWRHHPVTLVFLKFLHDKREFLKNAATEQWLGGAETFTSINQTVRGQIVELQEIENLAFEAIQEFYKEEEVNAAEDSQDKSR